MPVIAPIATVPVGSIILAADPHNQKRASALICQIAHLQMPPYSNHRAVHHRQGHTLSMAAKHTKFGPIKEGGKTFVFLQFRNAGFGLLRI